MKFFAKQVIFSDFVRHSRSFFLVLAELYRIKCLSQLSKLILTFLPN